jgi:hypothetical protein
MRRLSRVSVDDEISAAHRIFNHVESVVGPYYGTKTRMEAKNFVSANRWIMFPEYHIKSLREGSELPIPNIFVHFDGDVADNDTGLMDGYIGLTFHNVQAMWWLNDILRRNERAELFLNILHGFGDEWNIEIQHKTQTDSPESTPRYKTVSTLRPSKVTGEQITQAIIDSDRTLLHRDEAYPDGGNPVLWDVTIFVVRKQTITARFDLDVKKVFDLFLKTLNLR